MKAGYLYLEGSGISQLKYCKDENAFCQKLMNHEKDIIKYWLLDTSNRIKAIRILFDAYFRGAENIDLFIKHWSISYKDFATFAMRCTDTVVLSEYPSAYPLSYMPTRYNTAYQASHYDGLQLQHSSPFENTPFEALANLFQKYPKLFMSLDIEPILVPPVHDLVNKAKGDDLTQR